jgi:hypothetical protein
MADDNPHLRITGRFDSRELARLTRGDVVSVQVDEVEDAFREWDETTRFPQAAAGSRGHGMPVTARTTTLSDPATTARLAKGSQRIAVPQFVPRSLEEALLALADGLIEP